MELKKPWNGLVHHDITSHGGNRQRIFGMGFLLLNTDEEGGLFGIWALNTQTLKKEKRKKQRRVPRGIGIYGFSVMCLLG